MSIAGFGANAGLVYVRCALYCIPRAFGSDCNRRAVQFGKAPFIDFMIGPWIEVRKKTVAG